MSETYHLETFTVYRPLEARSFEAGGYTVRLEPRRLLGETPVRFYWLFAHPTSAYYMEDR